MSFHYRPRGRRRRPASCRQRNRLLTDGLFSVAALGGSAVGAVGSIGSNRCAGGIGHQGAVQRPIPVTVFFLFQADERGVAFISFIAFLPIQQGDGATLFKSNSISLWVSPSMMGTTERI